MIRGYVLVTYFAIKHVNIPLMRGHLIICGDTYAVVLNVL